MNFSTLLYRLINIKCIFLYIKKKRRLTFIEKSLINYFLLHKFNLNIFHVYLKKTIFLFIRLKQPGSVLTSTSSSKNHVTDPYPNIRNFSPILSCVIFSGISKTISLTNENTISSLAWWPSG